MRLSRRGHAAADATIVGRDLGSHPNGEGATREGRKGKRRSLMSRVAVVTGGGSGMGRAICRQLARQGRNVAVLDVNGDAADEVAKEIDSDGVTAMGVQVDVSDRAAIDGPSTRCGSTSGPSRSW